MHIDPINPQLKPPGTQRLKLKCGILLSVFAFKSDLRRYIKTVDSQRQQFKRFGIWAGACTRSR